MSLGDWKRKERMLDKKLPGNPIVVPFVPQSELLKQVDLMITHAGANTTYDGLYNGVPMVSLPVTNDQPALAARIAWTKTGRVIPFSKISVKRLKKEIQEVSTNPTYRQNAQRMKKELSGFGGVTQACEIIEGIDRSTSPVFPA